MELIIEKLHARTKELVGMKCIPVKQLEEFQAWVDSRDQKMNYLNPPCEEPFLMKTGGFWKSEDGYLWMRCMADIPARRSGYSSIGYFNYSSIEEGYASGFESMLYVDGIPFQGVDDNHMIVVLDRFAGQCIELTFQLWVGITGGPPAPITHHIQEAYIGYLDYDIERVSILAEQLLDHIETMDIHDVHRIELLKMLNTGFNQLYWLDKASKCFAESVKKVLLYLENELEKEKQRSGYTIHCIGHTHIDLAWMWQIKHTREKAARSFSTVMRLFEQYPEYKFFQSTPQIYEYIKEDQPALYEEIKEYVSSGRWEPGGGMWVEADCNLISGESLVRQIMYAKEFFKEEFNIDTKFLWLPDAFGFTWALPQILKLSGIDTFITSKLSWNKQNRFPHDTFYWKGMDGSQVIGYFMTTPADGFPTQEWAVTYNGDISPKVLKGTWELYQEKRWNHDVMMTYGHGDGGGGSTREMVEKINAIGKLPYAPEVTFSTVGEFLERVKCNIELFEEIPIWEDELYLEYHRGTFTSQAAVKRANRKLENLLRDVELLLVCEAIWKKNRLDLVQRLDRQWKILLHNQFHDIIPGSSIKKVYEDAIIEYTALEEELNGIKNGLWRSSSKADSIEYFILNNASWTRDLLIQLEAPKEWKTFEDQNRKRLESIYLGEEKHLVLVENVQGLGWLSIIGIRESASEEQEVQRASIARIDLQSRSIETDLFQVHWNEKGQITRLYSIFEDIQVLDKQPGNTFAVYEDKPLLFDAWDIDAFYKENCDLVEDLVNVAVVENSSLRAVIRFTYRFHLSTIWQELVFIKDKKRVDFVTKVDWQEKQRLLKVHFPLNVKALEAVYDIQFGNIRRSTHENTSYDKAKFEVVGHQWADISQRDRGVSLLNDCKYGYDTHGSTMGLTLIKSAVDPDETADRGIHEFTYAIYPHRKDWYDAQTPREAFDLNNPPVLLHGIPCEKAGRLLEIEGTGIMVDAIKRAQKENYLIVRLHEYGGGDSYLGITSPYEIEAYCECNLLEENLTEWVEKSQIEVVIKPYEIKTFKLKLKMWNKDTFHTS